MNAQRRLDTLLAEHRSTFNECAELNSKHDKWSLEIFVCVIDDRNAQTMASLHKVGLLGSVISTSAAIDIPEVRRWIELANETSPEKAFDVMLNGDEEVAEAFAEGYDLLQQERRDGIEGLWSASDLSRFVIKTRDAFPTSVACVAILPGEDMATHCIMTFEHDITT